MRLFNFGSLNIDHVYSVDQFVRPGETIHAQRYQQYCGGKGLNQSLAAARAGMQVVHVGQVGGDAGVLAETLDQSSVDTALIKTVDQPTGHAIIQVDSTGENEIIVFGGANQALSKEMIDTALSLAELDDWVLCQNETNQVDYLLHSAAEKGLFSIFNPAPMTPAVKDFPLHKVGLMILNQSEAAELSHQTDDEAVVENLRHRFAGTRMVLTLGARGAVYFDQQRCVGVPAEEVSVVDSTGAGDTFIGYFVNELAAGQSIENCLATACRAAAECVQTAGAADSIPARSALPAEFNNRD